MKVTKKLINELLEEYIEDGDKPLEGQTDSRFADCFDASIIDEFKAQVNNVHISSEEELRRIFRRSLRRAEEHANDYKRGRVINKDIAYSFQT